MGVLSTASHSEEILTIHEIGHPPIPQNLDENPDVLGIQEDFKQLDIPRGIEPVSYSPDDLLNYNDGLPANPFNKLAKVYGRHKDVFLFVAVVFNPKQHDKFVSVIREKCDDDLGSVEKFMRKMKTYKNRISKGTEDAKEFLPEELKDCQAFFNGFHIDNLPRRRNIHENLNINVVATGKKLETSQLLAREIPGKEPGSSELRRLKIYANGQRAMTVYKEDGGQRSYTPTKAAVMDLEIKWVARDPHSGEEIKCQVLLACKDGRLTVKKGEVEGDGKTNLTLLELAKQNESVLIRNKSLHQLLEKKGVANVRKPRESAPFCMVPAERSVEKLIPIGLPEQLETVKDKMDSVSKLSFAPELCTDPKDEMNYNDGKAANPFDKLAKIEGRQKDVFQFNRVLRDPQQFDMMMSIVKDKCGEENAELKERFIKRKEIYLKRVGQGEHDAAEIIGKDVDPAWMKAFTHGYHVAQEGHPRNIHSNLNINLTNVVGKSLEISEYLGKVTPRMEQENSNVERVKIYGNGRRLVNITKDGVTQRKYSFSRLAKMEMEIEWVARKKDDEGKEMEVMCSLVLSVNAGHITVKQATIDEVPVDLELMLEMAKQNRTVLVGNADLAKLLGEMVLLAPAQCMLLEGVMGQELKLKRGEGWKGKSKEKLIIHEFFTMKNNVGGGDELKSLLEDVARLDYTNELCQDPNDALNYNEGLKANQFSKLRKYWGRHKSLLVFLSMCEDPNQREKMLEVVASKCGDMIKVKEKFEKQLNIFLARMEVAKLDAEEFLKSFMKDSRQGGVSAVFGGYHVPQQSHARNIHANLNVNLENNKPELTLLLPDLFLRRIPRMDEEKSQLDRIKLFGNGNRILTIMQGDQGQRNYVISSLVDMDFWIEWSVNKEGDMVQQDVELLLNIKNGVVGALQGKVDGKLVAPAVILELAKDNQEILFRKKGLYEVLHEWLSKEEPLMSHSSGSGTVAQVDRKNADDEFVVIDDDDDGASSDDMFGQW